jgi:hypothetical protein
VKRKEDQLLDLKGILLRLEQELLSPQVRAAAAELDRLLAREFVEFGSSGRIYDKQTIIRTLTRSGPVENFQIEDFKVVTENEDTALVRYACKALSAAGDVIRQSNRCSLWQLIDGRWQMVFHQGTRAK